MPASSNSPFNPVQGRKREEPSRPTGNSTTDERGSEHNYTPGQIRRIQVLPQETVGRYSFVRYRIWTEKDVNDLYNIVFKSGTGENIEQEDIPPTDYWWEYSKI